jgi:hypothetical protein
MPREDKKACALARATSGVTGSARHASVTMLAMKMKKDFFKFNQLFFANIDKNFY